MKKGVQFLRFDVKPNTKWTRDHKARGRSQGPGEPDVMVEDLGTFGILSEGKQRRKSLEAAESCPSE